MLCDTRNRLFQSNRCSNLLSTTPDRSAVFHLRLMVAFGWVPGAPNTKSKTCRGRRVRFFVCLRDFGETARLWEKVPDQGKETKRVVLGSRSGPKSLRALTARWGRPATMFRRCSSRVVRPKDCAHRGSPAPATGDRKLEGLA